MDKIKIHVSWSGGKDSALALHRIVRENAFEVAGLHTVIEKGSGRVGIHQVPEELIQAQADLMGFPLTKLYLRKKPLAYEKLMKDYYQELYDSGIERILFGDIFLEDLKDFRESLLKASGVKGIYPLWGMSSKKLVDEFLKLSFKTHLCAVDSKFIDSSWVGKQLSYEFLEAHPNIDPCGENGEYHSLVVDGPLFKKPLDLTTTEYYEQDFEFKVKDEQGNAQLLKDRFYFAEFDFKASNS